MSAHIHRSATVWCNGGSAEYGKNCPAQMVLEDAGVRDVRAMARRAGWVVATCPPDGSASWRRDLDFCPGHQPKGASDGEEGQ